MGDLFELTDHAIAKWEKEDNVPRYADALVRNLVREKLGGNAEVTELLTQLAESERQEYLQRLEFSKSKNQDEWKPHQTKKRA